MYSNYMTSDIPDGIYYIAHSWNFWELPRVVHVHIPVYWNQCIGTAYQWDYRPNYILFILLEICWNSLTVDFPKHLKYMTADLYGHLTSVGRERGRGIQSEPTTVDTRYWTGPREGDTRGGGKARRLVWNSPSHANHYSDSWHMHVTQALGHYQAFLGKEALSHKMLLRLLSQEKYLWWLMVAAAQPLYNSLCYAEVMVISSL